MSDGTRPSRPVLKRTRLRRATSRVTPLRGAPPQRLPLCGVRRGLLAVGVVATVAVACAAISAAPRAVASDCPAAQLVFARGTGEAPGPGPVGDALAGDLTAHNVAEPLDVYSVDYPAGADFRTAIDGIVDASDHVVTMTAQCPSTRLILAGYSQGAAVMGFVTSAAVPSGVDPATVPKPLNPRIADHVAAVLLFGKPSSRFMRVIDQPDVEIGPLYAGKTLELCVPNDIVCSDGFDLGAHRQYVEAGLVDEAARYAAQRL